MDPLLDPLLDLFLLTNDYIHSLGFVLQLAFKLSLNVQLQWIGPTGHTGHHVLQHVGRESSTGLEFARTLLHPPLETAVSGIIFNTNNANACNAKVCTKYIDLIVLQLMCIRCDNS